MIRITPKISLQFCWRMCISTLCVISILIVPAAGLDSTHTSIAQAATVDDLKAQQLQLELKAKQAEQQAQQQKTVAQRAADKIDEVRSQITGLQSSILNTNGTIGGIQDQIAEQNQQVASLESQARQVSDQQDALIRRIYEQRTSKPDILIPFSNEPLSKREQEQAQYAALKHYIKSVIDQTNQARQAVITARAQLQDKNDQLIAYRDSQQTQTAQLADVKSEQAQLQQNAEAAVVVLEQKARDARKQEQSIENQVSAMLAAAIAAVQRGASSFGPGEGGRVTRGQFIGLEGSTGYSTGPHVHFEIRVNSQHTNPLPYVNGGEVNWPLNDFITTQGYGYTDYSAGHYANDFHTGIDIAARAGYGAPVYAPCGGIMILNRWYGGYGHARAVQCDNGVVALMGHMQ